MRKIKMIKTACGPKGSFTAPYEYTVSDELAESLVKSGSAKYVKTTAEVPVVNAPEPEPKAEPVKKAPPAKKKAVAKKAPAKFKPGTKAKLTGDE